MKPHNRVGRHVQSTVVSRIVYDIVRDRSGGHCEAVVEVPWGNATISLSQAQRPLMARCGQRPIEIHHRVTRARGGEVLDRHGETYHLMALCRRCHNFAHDQAHAFDNGLLLEGSVIAGAEGPIYTGPDNYLKEHYGAR